jgi:hypothetical protein
VFNQNTVGIYRQVNVARSATGATQPRTAPAAPASTLLGVERNTLYYGENLDVLRRWGRAGRLKR